MFQSSKDLVKKFNEITKCSGYSMPLIHQSVYTHGSHDIMNFVLSKMDADEIERFSDKPADYFRKQPEFDGYSPEIVKEAIQMYKRYEIYWGDGE